jgi:HEAT repeat protein
MLNLLRRHPDAVPEAKATLRSLVELAGKRSMTVQLEPEGVTVEGVWVPTETPFIALFIQQMQAHGIAAIHIGHKAPALDVMLFLRALAPDPATSRLGAELTQQMHDAKISGVTIVSTDLGEAARERRGGRITEALQVSGVLPRDDAANVAGLVMTSGEATFSEMLRAMPARTTSVSNAVAQLRERPGGAGLVDALAPIEAGIKRALERKEIEQVIEALVALLDAEEAAITEDAQRAFGITLQRVLEQETVRQVARYLFDEIFAEDVVRIVQRVGTRATKVLFDLLIEAPTFAERRAYLQALRQIESGGDVVAGMLSHPAWYVVRNAADLVGELGVAEAVPALGGVVEHEDRRVRHAAGVALAKIGSPGAIGHLRKVLKDPDPEVRVAVAKELRGYRLGALVMPIVSVAESEQNLDVLCEYYRALGRIGTPAAIQVLARAVQPGGLFAVRRSTAPRRAAAEGLALAGGKIARDMLQALAHDRDRDVRETALNALQHPPRREAPQAES